MGGGWIWRFRSGLGALLIAMEETEWDTALAPHPAGCCKDRAAARPDPCNGRRVGHFLRGPAGSFVIEFGSAGEGLGVGQVPWAKVV